MEKILIISPHPDDDAIGCGGTISRHILSGDVADVIYLTSGEKGGHGIKQDLIVKVREEEAFAATKILGISGLDYWREPDGNLKPLRKNIVRLLDKIRTFSPNVIYVTHDMEEHPDHRAAAKMVQRAVNQIDYHFRPVVRMYEVWTPIQRINYIVDISDYTDIKRKAINAHQSQCSILRFDEAVLGLNRYRGEMHSWPGGPYAEVFSVL